MSFFSRSMDDIPEEPEPEPQRARPPWFGPPAAVLPATLSDRAVVFRNDQALLAVDHLNVYPTGLQFTLNLWLRHRTEMRDMPWELRHGRSSPDDPEFLRLGVEFSDGSTWTNLPNPRMRNFEDEPDGPVVFPQGGVGRDNHWSMAHWLWPLPTPGDLTVYASWPAYDVEEASAKLDGSRIIEAASRAEVIWPDSES